MICASPRSGLFWLLAVVMVAGCNRPEQPRARELEARVTQTATFDSTVRTPARLSSIESGLRDPLGRPIRVACVTCHSLRTPERLPESTAELDEFHVGLSFQHGALSCASCHVLGAQKELRLADGRRIPMTDVLSLCSQCHGPQRRSYDNGVHGGMSGYWDTGRGERARNNCVDCHDPHVPAYQSGFPVHSPHDRGVPVKPPGELSATANKETHDG